ncbi:gelsolin-like [Pieris rapae]|uniref:gelsolin-like n=1 Tax=Pieris rapae TaxID=64459 RepID=UPI001E27C4C1|nr:gelsolin-like [Pieris rapae]XP_045489835.1 gelsolin-like [Pieris rapae]
MFKSFSQPMDKDLVPEESAGGDDQAFEKNEENIATLSEVSDGTGSVKVKALQKPYTQAQLKSQETYILDTVSGSIYVWLGKQASHKVRKLFNLTRKNSSFSFPTKLRFKTRIPHAISYY